MRTLGRVALFVLFIACYSRAADKQITMCDIAKQPAAFDGKVVTVTAKLLIAFERRELTSSGCKYSAWANLTDSTYAEVKGRWNEPLSVEVTGRLHTKTKSYGHMGAWPAELDIEFLKLINQPAPENKK